MSTAIPTTLGLRRYAVVDVSVHMFVHKSITQVYAHVYVQCNLAEAGATGQCTGSSAENTFFHTHVCVRASKGVHTHVNMCVCARVDAYVDAYALLRPLAQQNKQTNWRHLDKC